MLSMVETQETSHLSYGAQTVAASYGQQSYSFKNTTDSGYGQQSYSLGTLRAAEGILNY